MSIHGVCFDNGQSGNCNIKCEDFQNKKCEVYIEVIDAMNTSEYSLDEINEAKELYNLKGE